MDNAEQMSQPEYQVDPQKLCKQLQQQRNSALDQAAQCVALIETLDEQLKEVSDQLADAHKKIAEMENVQKSPAPVEYAAKSA